MNSGSFEGPQMVSPAVSTPYRLRMQKIEKRFGATVALDGVDLTVRPGEVLALIGENGAGKSTLMKVLSGACKPDSGTMELDGQRYIPANPRDARSRGVAMIYQELSLVPHLTVAENILLGAEPGHFGVLKHRAMNRVACDALAELGHRDIDPRTTVGSLSVGQQQLVEIARAVAVGCRVLVLDEPTSSLADRDVKRLFGLIRRLREQGHAIVYISHFLEEVVEIADRYEVLRDGESVGFGSVANTDLNRLIELMVGRQVTDLYPRSPRTPGNVVLSVERLGGFPKPESVSFELRGGEVLGIAGLVGAGRTELLRTVFGLDSVRQGRIKVKALRGPVCAARRWAQGVGFLSEDRKSEGLIQTLSVSDNMTMSSTAARRFGWFVSPARLARDSDEWISQLGIRCRSAGQPVGELSGGNQQKVAIARLLHHDVDVLLLDEPTRGVDVGSKSEIYQIIDRLASEGKAVLFVSSYLPELLGVADRIAVMNRGRLGPARPVAELDQHRLMKEAAGNVE